MEEIKFSGTMMQNYGADGSVESAWAMEYKAIVQDKKRIIQIIERKTKNDNQGKI